MSRLHGEERRLFAGLLRLACVLIALVSLAAPRRALAGPSDGLAKPDAPIDRATPRRAYEGFVAATRAADFVRAAHYLDLRDLKRADQSREGPLIAKRLAYVIDRELIVDLTRLPDTADGSAPTSAPVSPSTLAATPGPIVAVTSNGTASTTIGTMFLEDSPVPISLTRVKFDDGVQRWVVSRTTVAMVPALYKTLGPTGFEDKLPPIIARWNLLGVAAWQWIGLALLVATALFVGHIVGSVAVRIGRRLAKKTASLWDDELVEAALGPTRLMVAVVGIRFGVEPLRLTAAVDQVADQISYSILVVGVAWFLIHAMRVSAHWVQTRLPSGRIADDRHRGLRTQLAVMHRVASMLVVVIGGAVILMQFDRVRSVGMSLLASAGVVGLVVGLAAQKSLTGMIAGIQLSITQPIRIGDVVVVEGENGTIEEINLTYIVVRIWDDRRLIVPISRFLDQPFQNWTKVDAALLGVVMLTVDFACPIEPLRNELVRACAAHEKWDRRLCKLRVLEANERGIVLRGLVSASNSDDLFELRCDLREQLVSFLQQLDGGAYLPRSRAESVVCTPATLGQGALPG